MLFNFVKSFKLTIEEIHKEANERYQLKPGCCRIERRQIMWLKARYIEKKMREFGLKEEDNKVNS